MCIETGEIFPSAREAARVLNIQHSNIVAACAGKKQKTAKGYHWKYITEEES